MNEDLKKTLKGALDEAYKVFEDAGIEPMLLGHTLLFAYRDKDFIDSPQVRIIDIGCKAENITPEIRERLFSNGHFSSSLQGNHEHTLMYFRYNDCSVELLPVFKHNDTRYLNMVPHVFHTWPASMLDKYSEIEFLGTKYRTVGDIEGWLKTYYGDGWSVKDDNFRWQSSPTKRDMSDEIPVGKSYNPWSEKY